MRRSRTCVSLLAAGALLGWLLIGCGASARAKTISAALASTDAASKSFEAFDLEHQRAILAASKDDATYKAEIAIYRAEQVKVEQLLAGTYRAVAAAATVDDDQSLSALAAAALILAQELHAIGVL